MAYPLRLRHPEHGYHYVYGPDDEARHRAIGWGDEVKAAPQVQPDPVSPFQASPAPDGAAPDVPAKRKYTRRVK